jgi:hypothetical protein
MFVSKHDFLQTFNTSDDQKPYQVRIRTRLVPLTDYATTKQIQQTDIDKLMQHINTKQDYLTRFYNTSMTPPKNMNIQENPMPETYLNNNALVKYKNVIRNMFYKEILQETQSGLANIPSFLVVLIDLYVNRIIDYKILTPSAIHYLNNGRIGSVFSSFYFRASIMNPYLVFSLNQSVLKGRRIFTPTMGWSSYLYGFLECPDVIEYVGTDVIPSVCEKSRLFAKQFYPNKDVTIYESPSENLLHNPEFIAKYENHFDTVFFSPPYWQLEMYSSPNQSTTAYPTYEEWLKKYWAATIQLCHKVMRENGKLCYILSGYNGINLLEDMNAITAQYFTYSHTQPMHNKNVAATTHRTTAEQIVVFRKPTVSRTLPFTICNNYCVYSDKREGS